MINYKTKYIDAKKEIESLAADIADENSMKNFSTTVEEKIKDFKPSLMLYGTYNSGKSTLLNAIYGAEEKAKTGDSPETFEITAYDWNGYTIYDTPGIDAPVEHEKLTEEHLSKTEIVLFVVSNDGAFEEDFIYQKISDIVLTGKPIVVILNNKTGLDCDSIELHEALVSINKKLIEIGDRRKINNIENKVKVLFVDAQTALDGKIENEELLLIDSNIRVIEDEIDKLFHKSGMGEVIANLNRYFEQFIDQLIQNIDANIENKLVKELEKQITKLSSENSRNNSSIKLQAEKEIQYLGDQVKSLLLDGASENELEQITDEAIHIITLSIEDKLEKIIQKIQADEEEHLANFEHIEIKTEKVSPLSDNQKEDEIPEEVKEAFDKAGEVFKQGLGDKKIVTDGAKEVLLQLRKFGVKGFKGKWERTLGKTAAKIGKWAGPAVKVGMAGYDLYKANDEHNQMIQEKREFTQAAQNEANKLTTGVKNEISNGLNDSLSSIYIPLINTKKEMIKKITSENNKYSATKDKLSGIKVKFI